MWEQLSTQVSEAVVSVAAGLVALGAAAASYYLKKGADRLKAETSSIQDQAKAKLMWHAIERLEDTAEKVVTKTEQTVAGQLREAVKAGKENRSNLIALGQMACDEILQTLEPDVVQMLQENMGDLQSYVLSTVETLVNRLKESKEKIGG